MADNTTTTPTPQSNGVPLSALPALTAPVNGEELLLITKNNQSLKTTAAALKAYINAEMATLAGMQQAVKTVSDRIDALVNGDASSAIDTFNEIEAFLTGITDTETLTGLLAELKSTITAETDNKLNTKVDKVNGKGLSANDYTNDEKQKLDKLPSNEQFGHVGYIRLDGTFGNSSDYKNSGYVAINHNADLEFLTTSNGNVSSVAFYDGAKQFISAIQRPTSAQTIPAAEIPENAAFFIVSTYKNANAYYHNGPTIESRENATVEAIAASKLALFVDQFNAAAGSNGKYDPKNAPDPQHPFYLNELWLTYEEAIKTYGQNGRDAIPYARAGVYINTRTNLPLTLASWGGALSNSEIEGLPAALFIGNPYIEVALISVSHEIVIRDLRSMFERCGNLRKVIDYLILGHSTRTDRAFMGCVKLETINLRNLACNISLADSPLLSLTSLQYLVTNAANTSEITVTVHPDVYAKLSGDTTNAAAAALTADELAAWQAVMTSAASKNIAFATTV